MMKMINPVHAYYQIIFLSNLYYETEDSTDDIYHEIAYEIMEYFINMKFENFEIQNVYDDGDCYINIYNGDKQEFVKLKDVLLYDKELT